MSEQPQKISSTAQILPLEGVLEAAIYMDDLEEAKAFYGGVLGLEEVTAREGNHVFFRCGTTVVLVFDPTKTTKQSLDARLAIPPHGSSGASHICFGASGNQLDHWKILLQEKGVAIESEITWPNGARSFYFRDPGGNSLEVAQPRLWGYEEKETVE